jgi:hypothetical protein
MHSNFIPMARVSSIDVAYCIGLHYALLEYMSDGIFYMSSEMHEFLVDCIYFSLKKHINLFRCKLLFIKLN